MLGNRIPDFAREPMRAMPRDGTADRFFLPHESQNQSAWVLTNARADHYLLLWYVVVPTTLRRRLDLWGKRHELG